MMTNMDWIDPTVPSAGPGAYDWLPVDMYAQEEGSDVMFIGGYYDESIIQPYPPYVRPSHLAEGEVDLRKNYGRPPCGMGQDDPNIRGYKILYFPVPNPMAGFLYGSIPPDFHHHPSGYRNRTSVINQKLRPSRGTDGNWIWTEVYDAGGFFELSPQDWLYLSHTPSLVSYDNWPYPMYASSRVGPKKPNDPNAKYGFPGVYDSHNPCGMLPATEYQHHSMAGAMLSGHLGFIRGPIGALDRIIYESEAQEPITRKFAGTVVRAGGEAYGEQHVDGGSGNHYVGHNATVWGNSSVHYDWFDGTMYKVIPGHQYDPTATTNNKWYALFSTHIDAEDH